HHTGGHGDGGRIDEDGGHHTGGHGDGGRIDEDGGHHTGGHGDGGRIDELVDQPVGGKTDQQACEDAGGIWAEKYPKGGYCGAAPPPADDQVSPEDAIKQAASFVYAALCTVAIVANPYGGMASKPCLALWTEAANQGGALINCMEHYRDWGHVCLGIPWETKDKEPPKSKPSDHIPGLKDVPPGTTVPLNESGSGNTPMSKGSGG
ncbi:hypothetical protein ACWD7C_39950, partial [Streptomyces sp. NPDC005134]